MINPAQTGNRIKWMDAVRVFGLALVLGYHLFYSLFPGGFLGVDIFLTFSGFLLTALAIEEFRKKRSFSLLDFYRRRLKRIAIPLFLAVIITLPLTLLISGDFTVGIDRQLASVFSFSSNWYFISIGSSYETQLLPPLYNHTWTISALMQLYVVWGALCALLSFLLKRIHKNKEQSTRQYDIYRYAVMAVSSCLAAGSFIYMQMLYSAEHSLDFIYFNTASRAFPFFIGSVFASLWGFNPNIDKTLKKRYFTKYKELTAAALIIAAVGAGAVIVLVFAQFTFIDWFIYRFGFLFTSLLTVVLIYCMHALHILTAKNTGEPRVLTWASQLSYDIFLVHWPVYIVASDLIPDHVTASLTTFFVSLGLAALSVNVVQRGVTLPWRKDGGGDGRVGGKFVSWIYSTVALIVVAAGIAGSVPVVTGAPVMTSIEADFIAGYVTGDAYDIAELGISISDINVSPVLYRESTPLQAVLLPEPSTDDGQNGVLLPWVAYDELLPPDPELDPSESLQSVTEALSEALPDGVTIIGDSVPLGAAAVLRNTIENCVIDAETSRPVSQGLNVLKTMQRTGELREYVVIALGTNGSSKYEQFFTDIIETLNPGHRLVIVTPYDGRDNSNGKIVSETAGWIRELEDVYEFITVADWADVVTEHSNVLAGDKVHLRGSASRNLYASVVAEAVEAASLKPGKSDPQ